MLKKRAYLERTIPSEHELRLLIAIRTEQGWATVEELAERAKLKRRIVHEHLTRWLEMSMVERIKLFPNHRWRLASTAANQTYYTVLDETIKALGWE